MGVTYRGDVTYVSHCLDLICMWLSATGEMPPEQLSPHCCCCCPLKVFKKTKETMAYCLKNNDLLPSPQNLNPKIWSQFFSQRVTNEWNSLPNRFATLVSMNEFKRNYDNYHGEKNLNNSI